MKKMKILLSLCLVACMMLCLAPLKSTASAEGPWDWLWYWYWGHECRTERWGRWYEVTFTGVKNTEVPGYSNFSFYYNQWAKTLIVRGTGEMPVFDKDHPAPWADLKDKAERVILERNITTISAQAFDNFTKLKSVVLPSTIKSIDPNAFVKCENLTRLEYAGDLDNLDNVLKLCGTKELTEARVVKLTEKMIKDEVWQLTWYRVGDDRIEYDRAGRPVRIVWTTKDGYRFDTAIQYVNEAETNIRSEDVPGAREVVQKNETTLTFPNGVQTRSETEKNDLGQTSYASNVVLDSRGRPVVGSQSFKTETGTYKTGTLDTLYYWDGSSTRVWDNTLWGAGAAEAGSEQVIEQVNAFGQIMSVTTTAYDKNDKVVGTSQTSNSYDIWGNLTVSSTTSKDEGGATTSSTTTYDYDKFGRMVSSKTTGDKTGSEQFKYDKKGNLTSYTKEENGVTSTVEYSYDKNGRKISKTETSGGETVTTSYNPGEKAGKETSTYVDDGGKTHKSETSYSYKGGVVSERIVNDTADDGSKTTGKDTFNADGLLVKSVRETTDGMGNVTTTVVTYTYDAMGRKTGETTTLSAGGKSAKSAKAAALSFALSDEASTDAKAAAMLADEGDTESTTTVTFDPETGVKLSEVQEVKTAKFRSLTSKTFALDGKQLTMQSEITELGGASSNYSSEAEYDEDGKLKAEKEEIVDFDNNKESSDYLYEDDKQIARSTTKTAQDGTETKETSTFTYDEDGNSVETVTQKDEDGVAIGSFTVLHDAPVNNPEANIADGQKPSEENTRTDDQQPEVKQDEDEKKPAEEKKEDKQPVEIADGAVPLSLNMNLKENDSEAEIVFEDEPIVEAVEDSKPVAADEKQPLQEDEGGKPSAGPAAKSDSSVRGAADPAEIVFADQIKDVKPVQKAEEKTPAEEVKPAEETKLVEEKQAEPVKPAAEEPKPVQKAEEKAPVEELKPAEETKPVEEKQAVPEVKPAAEEPKPEPKAEEKTPLEEVKPAEETKPVEVKQAEPEVKPAVPEVKPAAEVPDIDEAALAQAAAAKAEQEAAERAAKEAEEKARKEAEEKAHKEAEEKARKEAEEKARKAAEEKARKEAEEKARKEAAEQAAIAAQEAAKAATENTQVEPAA